MNRERKPANESHFPQSNGALYGIGTGVSRDSCSAKGPGSKPLEHHSVKLLYTEEYGKSYLEKSYLEGADLPD